MNPIGFALRHPITIMVAIAGIVLGSVFGLTRMKIDVFPNLNLPVIYVIQAYGGMDPAQMEDGDVNEGYHSYCYLFGGGKLRRCEVEIGSRGESRFEIVRKKIAGEWNDFTGTDQVVSDNVSALSDGQSVVLVNHHVRPTPSLVNAQCSGVSQIETRGLTR